MGTGWRRAFCTNTPRDDDDSGSAIFDSQTSPRRSPVPSPRNITKPGFFSSSGSSNGGNIINNNGSNPATPRLRCRTKNIFSSSKQVLMNESPKLQCKSANTTPRMIKGAVSLMSSNPSSPRSPLKLSLFRNSFRLRNACGVCTQSVKTGQGMAIYTAECAHAFHFPCIAAHVRKHGALVCPVCNVAWKDVPLLAVHKNLPPVTYEKRDDDAENTRKTAEKKGDSSPRQYYHHRCETRISDVQSFDDDEPLVSPKTCSKFFPILENSVNEGDEVEEEQQEFQGFFVNPVRSCSINSLNSRKIEARLMPESAIISGNRNYETYAVVMRVKAPPPLPAHNSNSAPLLDPSRRAPIDLVTVLDVGKSMTGAKLLMLKRAMRLVISSLGSADRLSIIAFSACPNRLMPLRRMTAQGQQSARHIIDGLAISQGSCATEALSSATKVLEDRRERNPVASIILLSDSHDQLVQAKANPQRQSPVHSSATTTRFAHVEIPVNSFNDDKRGGYSHEPAEDAFSKCVGEFLSVVAQDLRIQLGFVHGSAPAEITAVYCCNGRPTVLSSGVIQLGDLYAEEERELLIEIKIPTNAVGLQHVMSIKCSYNDPATQKAISDKKQTLILPIAQTQRSPLPKIERLRSLFITTRAIAECRRLIELNAFSSAHHLLSSTRALLVQTNSLSADEYIKSLEGEIMELAMRRKQQQQEQQKMTQQRRKTEKVLEMVDANGEPLTPTSAWRVAEQLAKVAIMKKSMNKVSDLHGFEDARF